METNMSIFLFKKKDIKDSILVNNHTPSNLQEVKEMDEFMSHLLKKEKTESFDKSRCYLLKIPEKKPQCYRVVK